MRHVAILIIQVYRFFVSPLLPPSCRFVPTCSEYALQAFRQYGCFEGGILAFKRIFRCHPWGSHGHDPLK